MAYLGQSVVGCFKGAYGGNNGIRQTFGCVEDINRWLNKRLKLIDKSIDLGPYPLVLTSTYAVRTSNSWETIRYVYLIGAKQVCFHDSFEVVAASCINGDATYGKGLPQAINKINRLTDAEQKCVRIFF